ncbi:MAG: hypothetical protein HRT61_00375 [Ekhidna sp.]|jgi:hypothetical protein|nr:hypothetical protein [Ekhidna sp.]
MGTLRARLQLTSDDTFSSSIDLDLLSSINIDGGSINKAKVAAVAAGSSAMVVYKASDKLSAYLYIKNLDAEKENYVYVYNDANDDLALKVGGGEFAFMPIPNDQDFKVYGTKVDQLIEYGVLGLDSSSVSLA